MVTVALIVAIIGLVFIIWSPHPKVMRIGEICLLCGLLAWLLSPLGAKILV